MKITDDEMEKAVLFLTQTDKEFARRKSYFNGLERQIKTIKAMAFTRSAETTAAAREQASMIAPSYAEHIRKVNEAELDFLTLQEERNTAVTMIDVWRSLNSARAKGVL